MRQSPQRSVLFTLSVAILVVVQLLVSRRLERRVS
jgi:hypothetical protein